MKRVAIVGGGYAGLSAARRLGRRPDLHVRLLDPREHHQALPLLPDVAGGRLKARRVLYPLARAAHRWGFEHVREEVVGLDTDRGTLVGRSAAHAYDVCLLACGCGPVACPFDAGDRMHTLGDLESALALHRAFVAGGRRNWVVVGGGYTGVETVTHLWRCAQRERADRKLFLVERDATLCGALGAPFAEYIERNVTWLDVEAMTRTRVVAIVDGDVLLDGDRRVKDAALVWTVGAEGRRFLRELGLPQTPNGRLAVTPELRLERCACVFAAGDAAALTMPDGRPLRQSVQAALMQGALAADNILRTIDGQACRPYRHIDPGFVVPMGNGRGCGVALGLPIYGRLPVWLHAFMCAYRAYGANRGPALFAALLRAPRARRTPNPGG